jgi:hypothetical protein
VQFVAQIGGFSFFYQLSHNMWRDNGVRVQNVAQKFTFCFSYHIRGQICIVRTVLGCNMLRTVEASASGFTYPTTLWRENGVRVQFVAHRGTFCFCYHLTAKLCDERSVLRWNIWSLAALSSSVITYPTTLWLEKIVRVQFVAHRGSFCFWYQLSAQLCNLRTVLVCNIGA